MPGMMDTILNVGLSHSTIPGLAQMTGDEDFAWDSYMRLLRMFGNSVRGLPAPALAAARLGAEREGGGAKAAAAALEAAIESESGSPFPGDPRDQLRESIEAVLRSWQSPRAQRYRRHADIDEDLGTAVVVQAMVFGNLDQTSGSGVAFTRDPGSGEPNMYGDFLAGAQGEDVVSGEYDTGGLGECREHAPAAYQELIAAGAALERLFTDMCDIEFTIERGRLWVLQARVGQRTGLAEVRIAADLLEEGLIGTETALARISPAGLLRVAARVFDPAAERDLLGKGVPASPGAAVGVIATSSRSAEEFAAAGRPAILVRPETSPDDIAGFISAARSSSVPRPAPTTSPGSSPRQASSPPAAVAPATPPSSPAGSTAPPPAASSRCGSRGRRSGSARGPWPRASRSRSMATPAWSWPGKSRPSRLGSALRWSS
jgi:pyruvate,orthophosphate dikinase